MKAIVMIYQFFQTLTQEGETGSISCLLTLTKINCSTFKKEVKYLYLYVFIFITKILVTI